MNFTKTIGFAASTATIALPIMIAMASTAHATGGPGQAMHLNGKGKRICRALAAQPAPYWDAKVRGEFEDIADSANRFVIRTCFQTRSACTHFTSRFTSYVQNVEKIHYARCEQR
jgi:hypothetical protein